MQHTQDKHGKLRLDVGDVRFSGEGDQDWLDDRLERFIAAVNSGEIRPSPGSESPSQESPVKSEASSVGTLATYLKEKGADSAQTKKFLSTAAWLHHRGSKRVSTNMVTTALRDHQQKRLGNASHCLSRNIAQGYCEKDGNQFFITQEGWESLGEDSK